MKHNIFFIGAGGIGMAALERYCLNQKLNVGGYDLTETALTKKLIDEGVNINYKGTIDSIPKEFRDKENTLVVYTPAVKNDLPAFRWFIENGFEIIKRSTFLGKITESTKSLCFAGTHGKTTTSSICAHILNMSEGIGCNAFLGGILRNYNSNLLLSSTSPFSVIEADEYDRSFLTLRPYVAVITSADPDHLDIYENEQEYLQAFSQFTSLIVEGGKLLMHTGLKVKPDVKSSIDTYTYSSQGEKADFMAKNIKYSGGKIIFDMSFPDGTFLSSLELNTPLEINVDNSVAAIAAIWLAGCSNETGIRKGLSSYLGSERRFEKKWEEKMGNNRIIIDDYAHHPKEIDASIKALRSLYPERKLTIAFQPHLYSRTRDFASDFALALSKADDIILVDLYPAREKPIAGISSNTIFQLIQNEKKLLIDKEDFPETLKSRKFDILITMGAGDLPNYIPELIEKLEKPDNS